MDTIQILLRQLASLPSLTLRAEPPELLRTVERFLWELAAHADSSVTSLAIDGLAALATQRGSVIAHLQLCSALMQTSTGAPETLSGVFRNDSDPALVTSGCTRRENVVGCLVQLDEWAGQWHGIPTDGALKGVTTIPMLDAGAASAARRRPTQVPSLTSLDHPKLSRHCVW